MTLPLNVEMLAHAYDYLCCTPPFSKWNLPPSEEVKFGVIKSKDRQAHYYVTDGIHHIDLSSRYIGQHATIIATMAHELVHLHMHQACMTTRNEHNAAFHKLADRVCKIHGFDRLDF